MNEGTKMSEEKLSAEEQSPTEKLEEGRPTGTLIPGAQNPESPEIKKEINPNTE
jgi:hypothetical protein